MPVFLPLALLGPVLLAADAPPVPSTPPADCVALRFIDQPRLRARWQMSPYPALAATAWGRQLDPLVNQRPGAFQLLRHLAPIERGLLSVQVLGGDPVGQLHAEIGSDAPAAFAFTADPLTRTAATVEARIPLAPYHLLGLFRGSVLDWRQFPVLLPPATATPTLATADLELVCMLPALAAAAPCPLTASWTVTPYGLHERLRVTGRPHVAASDSQAAVPLPAVTTEALAGLPPTTLWALTTAALPEVLERVPGLDLPAFDLWAASQQLPLWKDLRSQLSTLTVWSEQGAPLPSYSLIAAMPENTAAGILALLDRTYEFTKGSDGVHLGVVGFIPVQAAWRAGRLVVTTSNLGIPGALALPGGFTTVPVISKALAQLAKDRAPDAGTQLVLGLSRSGDSWAALASLNPWLVRHRPELVTLANDLRRAGSFGFAGLLATKDGVVLDAGGLFGGPGAGSAILSSFFQLIFAPESRAVPAAKEVPPQAPPPVKMVEF
jgi:hypothetical protein